MGLLDAIKSKLGIVSRTATARESVGESAGDADEESAREPAGDADEESVVTVEHEPGDVDDPVGTDEPVAEATDAAGSTGSIVDEEVAQGEPTAAAEPAEAAGPEAEDVTIDRDEADGAPGGAPSEGEPGEGVSVQELTGIGSAYGDRLAEVGIETVAELAVADAAAISEQTSISESRLEDWITRAGEYEEE